MPERVHMSHEEYVAKRREQVLDLVRQAQSGKVGLLLAVREAHGILWELANLEKEPESADVMLLKGVESECDGLPLGSERQHWAEESLREKDVQAERYATQVRDEVLQTFVRIADDLKRLQ